MKTFTVQLADDLADKLSGMASVRGVTVEHLVAEGAESLADELRQEDDFRSHFTPDQITAIEAGLDAIERGDTIPHDQVMAEMKAKFGW